MKQRNIFLIAGAVIIGAALAIFALTKNSNDNNNTATQSTPNTSQSQNTAQPTQPTDSNTSEDTSNTNKVSIADMAFSPSHITVKKGTTVTWTNNDSTTHTVTGDTNEGPSSGNLTNGMSYTFTFNTVGDFKYHCNFHPQMTGTVTVTE